jgi:uncharacterized protein (TIGR02996 family)
MNNEEEALIRAVVDTPGDDTARLVYADWLDERDDPRGAYLRAELAWARSGEKERGLRTRAKKLNQLWVYRVSRPPVGVCFRHTVFQFTGPQLRPDAIDSLLDRDVPDDYLAFLLNYNGGLLSDLTGSKTIDEPSWQIEGFARLHDADDEEHEASAEKQISAATDLPTYRGLSASLWHPNVSNTGWGGTSDPVFDDCFAIAFERADYGHFNVILYRQIERGKKLSTQILFYRDPNGDENFYADAVDAEEVDEEEDEEENLDDQYDRIAREFDAEDAAAVIAKSFPAFLKLVDRP